MFFNQIQYINDVHGFTYFVNLVDKMHFYDQFCTSDGKEAFHICRGEGEAG